jgi:trans-2,3-dihydro-3-hydroxyanthranilate isomerase
MAIIPIHIVDAFADRPFTGNPAAIIPNAASLTDEEMLQIAEELSMEAGFVVPPDARDADVKIRFFTQRREATFSGHVVVAAFVSLADRGFFKPTPEGLQLRQETSAGVYPVTLAAGADGQTKVTLELPPPRFGEPVATAEIGAALHLPVEAFEMAGHRPQRVSCGFDILVTPVDDRDVIRGSFRDIESIQKLADLRGVAGLALFCPETMTNEVDYYCRYFFPGESCCEDVASGTSMGAIAAYAVENGLVPRQELVKLRFEQGHSLGRPNRGEVVVRVINDEIRHVELIGSGSVVMRGSFQFARRAKRAAI